MKTEKVIGYKLVEKHRDGSYGPLFVNRKMRFPLGEIIEAECGELVDEGHVKSALGALARHPGFHLAIYPDSPWIGKKKNGKLIRRKKHVWLECEILGDQIIVDKRLNDVPNGWYLFKTNAKQKEPWYITRYLIPIRELPNEEVVKICAEHGIVAQEVEE